jgi:hypothetical protein
MPVSARSLPPTTWPLAMTNTPTRGLADADRSSQRPKDCEPDEESPILLSLKAWSCIPLRMGVGPLGRHPSAGVSQMSILYPPNIHVQTRTNSHADPNIAPAASFAGCRSTSGVRRNRPRVGQPLPSGLHEGRQPQRSPSTPFGEDLDELPPVVVPEVIQVGVADSGMDQRARVHGPHAVEIQA